MNLFLQLKVCALWNIWCSLENLFWIMLIQPRKSKGWQINWDTSILASPGPTHWLLEAAAVWHLTAVPRPLPQTRPWHQMMTQETLMSRDVMMVTLEPQVRMMMIMTNEYRGWSLQRWSSIIYDECFYAAILEVARFSGKDCSSSSLFAVFASTFDLDFISWNKIWLKV